MMVPAAALAAPARSLALIPGSWSATIGITNNGVIVSASWDQTLYAIGWDSMVVSPDAGTTWNAGLPVAGAVVVEDYVMYRANITSYEAVIWFSASSDNGSTWTDPVQALQLAGWNDGAYGIAKFGSLLIVYSYENAGLSIGSLACARSEDLGATWGPRIVIDPEVHVEDPRAADMVMFNGDLYFAYYNYTDVPRLVYDLVVIQSADLGLTWSGRTIVGEGFMPLLKSDGTALYITYLDTSNPSRIDIGFTKSPDGASWTAPDSIAQMTEFTDQSNVHALAVAEGSVFVAYVDYDSSGPTFLVKVLGSYDGGASWHDLGNVAGGTGDEMYPGLLIAQSKLHLTWVDGDGGGGYSGGTYYRNLELLPDVIPEFSSLPVIVASVGLVFIGLFMRKKSH